MGYKKLLVAAVGLLLMCGCLKDDLKDLKEDFSNLSVQGEFDPTYGFPLAYFEAHMDTLVEFIRQMDSDDNLYVHADADASSGLLTLYAEYYDETTIDFTNNKSLRKRGTRKAGGDVLLWRDTLRHENEIRLGKYLIENDIQLKNLYVSLDATMIPSLTQDGRVDSLEKYGVEIYLDTLTIMIDLRLAMTAEQMNNAVLNDPGYVYTGDGYKYIKKVAVNSLGNGQAASLSQLATASNENRTFRLLDNTDIATIINNDAYMMHIDMPLNIVATEETDLAAIDPTLLNFENVLLLSGLDVKTRAAIEYSALLYVGNMNEIDTIEADCSGLAQYVDYDSYNDEGISITVREGDTSTYLVLKAENSMPFNLTLHLRGLDEHYAAVTGDLLVGDNFIESPAVEQVPPSLAYLPGGQTFVANQSVGYTKSELKFPLTRDQIEQLSKARYLELTMHIVSMASGAVPDPVDGRPFVILRDRDMLKLRLFVSAGAHLSLDRQLNCN